MGVIADRRDWMFAFAPFFLIGSAGHDFGRPQQRRQPAAKRVGDCVSFHNQFLNRPHGPSCRRLTPTT
jgi:hypothetical protein